MAGTESDMEADRGASAQKNLFCFGYGYCCDYLGYELMRSGDWNVSGTTRDPEKRDMLKERGVGAHLFDKNVPLPDPRYILRNTTHLLISTPPDDEGDPTFNMFEQDILQLENLEWVGYLSTTGVYGDRQGDWVDENSELRPTSKRGSRRKKAEEQWLSLFKSHNVPVHVFRLAGIYGPGRSALDSIRAGIGRRIDKPGHVFSRIHVEDIVRILQASFENPNPGAAYNVCDDQPAPSHVVIEHACHLLGRPVPELVPFDQAHLSPMARSFYNDNKRVRNDRIKTDLGVELKYKNYKDGLQGCLEAEDYVLSLFQNKTPV